ncbi:MAG: hypothetical protein RLZZ244_771 [Verrucomicrobiota bacterium]
MRVLVTGATGFVGSHFVEQALALGHEVVGIRRPGSQPRIPLPDHVQWIDAPLDADFAEAFKGVDCLVHLAAHTANVPYAPLPECLYWNVYAAARLVHAAAQAGVSRLLVAGTCFEYGSAAQGQEFVHPATELRPTLSYPISKAAASAALLGAARELGLRMQLLRIFQVYGRGESAKRFWPSLKLAAHEGRDFPMSAGTQVRDFIDVADVACAFVQALGFEGVEAGRPHVRNVGTGRGQSLLDFARFWWNQWGATGRLLPGEVTTRPGELHRLVADVESVHVG